MKMQEPGAMKMRQDTHIDRQDQEKINTFSKLYMKFGDLEDEVKKIKEEIENMRDAFDAIDETLGEEGALKLFMGEALISVDEDTARDYLEKVVE